MKQYEAYKSTGIEWIGEVPEHWRPYRIKYNTFLKGRIGWQGLKADEFKDSGYCLITGTDFDNNGGINWNSCYRISSERFFEDEQLHIKKGDILLTKDGTIGKLAYIGELPEPASLNSHLLIVRQKNDLILNSFLYYVLLSSVFKNFCYFNQTGSIMSSISQEMFSYFNCFVPTIKEQLAISNYLKEKCGSIDKVIATQEKRVALLNELKQSVISEAVTRGINPNITLKDTGIEWIGEIPEHWEVMPLKRTGSFGNGLTYSPDDVCDEDGILVLRSSNIQNDKLCFEDNVYVKDCSDSLMVIPGDIIICSRNGSASLVGKCAMVENELYATFGAFMMRYRPRRNANKKFAYYMLQAALKLHKGLYSTTTINQLTNTVINQITVSYPPLSEQEAIAKYLDEKCGRFDTLISKANREIELLKEYKQSIISEAVTGKIKVC